MSDASAVQASTARALRQLLWDLRPLFDACGPKGIDAEGVDGRAEVFALWHGALRAVRDASTALRGITKAEQAAQQRAGAAISLQDDDGCPMDDPDCLGNNGDCHDAGE